MCCKNAAAEVVVSKEAKPNFKEGPNGVEVVEPEFFGFEDLRVSS